MRLSESRRSGSSPDLATKMHYSINYDDKVVLVSGPRTCKEALDMVKSVGEVKNYTNCTVYVISGEEYLAGLDHKRNLKRSGNIAVG